MCRFIKKKRFQGEGEYAGLQMTWTSEMFGYNFACTHLGIHTTVVSSLQVRDVEYFKSNLEAVPMLHIGRAWFSKNHADTAEQWWHTEGADIRPDKIQVWFKLNATSSRIMPWPVPEGTDFPSCTTR